MGHTVIQRLASDGIGRQDWSLTMGVKELIETRQIPMAWLEDTGHGQKESESWRR